MWLSRLLAAVLAISFHTWSLRAQVDSVYFGKSVTDGTAFAVVLDSVVISDFKRGVDIPFFIRKTQTDESLYKAFKMFKYQSCVMDYTVSFANRQSETIGWYSGSNQQNYQNHCRTMKISWDSVSGRMFDEAGDYRFYTMKLIDRLFFTKGKVCGSEPEEFSLQKDTDRHINELKKLIFRPGTKADVPFIGAKMAIFDQPMARYYDFRLISAMIKGVDCYSFVITAKPEFQQTSKDATVVKFLETYFAKTNLQIIGRKYNLSYHGFWFDFEVNMAIELTKAGQKYLPKNILYDGYWDVPLKSAERGKFNISFAYD